MIERLARVIYGGDEARWVRNRNTAGVDHAKYQARAVLVEFAKWHDEMAKAVFAVARQIDSDWVKGCDDPEDRRANIKDRDEHYAISHWHEGCANLLRAVTAPSPKASEKEGG